MNTILVPVDGSTHALKALHIACDLADKYNGRIVLLHVLSGNRRADELIGLEVINALSPKLRSVLQDAAVKTTEPVPSSVLETVGEKILDVAAARVVRRGLQADVLAMSSGDPAEDIISAHKRSNANTIVMGCRGGNAAKTSSIGSVSNTVIQTADCTCIVVK